MQKPNLRGAEFQVHCREEEEHEEHEEHEQEHEQGGAGAGRGGMALTKLRAGRGVVAAGIPARVLELKSGQSFVGVH